MFARAIRKELHVERDALVRLIRMHIDVPHRFRVGRRDSRRVQRGRIAKHSHHCPREIVIARDNNSAQRAVGITRAYWCRNRGFDDGREHWHRIRADRTIYRPTSPEGKDAEKFECDQQTSRPIGMRALSCRNLTASSTRARWSAEYARPLNRRCCAMRGWDAHKHVGRRQAGVQFSKDHGGVVHACKLRGPARCRHRRDVTCDARRAEAMRSTDAPCVARACSLDYANGSSRITCGATSRFTACSVARATPSNWSSSAIAVPTTRVTVPF